MARGLWVAVRAGKMVPCSHVPTRLVDALLWVTRSPVRAAQLNRSIEALAPSRSVV